jgi:hypothetical protein
VSSKGGPCLLVAQDCELRKVPGGGQPVLTIASRDFARGGCQSSILQLTKPRVARGVSAWALADGYM